MRPTRLLASATLGAALAAALVGTTAWWGHAQEADDATAATSERIVFRHLGVEQGLPSPAVAAVTQDALGFVWVGTLDGLVRYDGAETREFRRTDDTTSLGSNVVQVLAPAGDGDLWVGTDAGLDRYDARSETFRRVRGLPSEAVVALAPLPDGGAWAGTLAGLARLDAEGTVVEVLRHDAADPDGLPSDEVEALYLAPDGDLWVGTGAGLARRSAASGAFTRLQPDALALPLVSAIAPTARGALLVGTFDQGLFAFDPASGRFEAVDLGPGGIGRNVVMDVHEGDDGSIWVATLGGGLRRIVPGAEAADVFVAAPDVPGSLASDEVADLFQDRQGILWVATYGGLDRFDQARATGIHLRADPENPASLASNDVFSVLHADGTLYVGTAAGLDRSDDARAFRSTPLRTADGQDHAVRALYRDREGTVWAGAEGGGLWRVTASGAERVGLGIASGDEEIGVQSLLEDDGGRFWMGSLAHGLVLFDRASGRAVPYGEAAGLPASPVLSLAEAGGTVWAGTERGLCRLDAVAGDGAFTCFAPREGGRTALANGHVGALYAQGETLWVGTRGGLHRLDTSDPEAGFTRFSTATSDLPGDDVRSIVQDDDGFLWLGTNGGLVRFDPIVETFSGRLGADATVERTLTAAATRDGNGRLYVGSRDGLLVFDPQQISAQNANPPEVAITRVEVAGQPVGPAQGGALDVAAPVAERITLDPDQDYLTIHYAGLHFGDPGRVTYRVRLDGFDDTWRDVGTQREAPYSTLPPRRYTFQVRAVSADGVPSAEAASIVVVVRPPWWRTWWAILGFIGLAAVGFVKADRWQRARLLRRERERAERRETELRAETAEAERRKAEAEASALKAENDRKAVELERAREVEEANAKLASANTRLEASLRDLHATQDQLVQSEKLASLGQLTAGIAHEIKNPLNFVNNFADLSVDLADELRQELHEAGDRPVAAILDDLGPILDDLAENARRIHEHGQRADQIVRAMLLHSRGGAGERARVDVNRFVDEYANLAYHGARASDADFQLDLVRDLGDDVGEVEIVPQELGRVLINLLTNAFHAVKLKRAEGFTPTVTLRTRCADNEVTLEMSDNGTGIPEAVRHRIFEPFFTTKATGEGTGLGLSLAHDIVTQVHGGRMSVSSVEGEGTTFTIVLPAQGDGPEAGQHPAASGSDSGPA
ncbi:MAG: two-component regulator propeller domain-containing protein [Bacteroidota bacterium]